jgi:peroxiredoxin
MVAISPLLPKYSRQVKKNNNLEFDILSDPGNEVSSEFGLSNVLPGFLVELYRELGADLERFNGDDSWSLPMPARYVAAADSRILNAEFDPDYKRRPEPADTLAFVRTIV